MSLKGSAFSRREVLTLPLVGVALSRPRRLRAVEPGRPSQTAVLVAASRAIGSRDPNAATRNPDHLAAEFLTPEDKELIKGTRQYDTFDMSWPEVRAYFENQMGSRLGNHKGFLPYVALNLRTRHLDDAVRMALTDGTEQIIILGAGLDSRAYRLTSSWETGRVFEVDFPPSQEYKKRKVESVIGQPPRNLTYVPIDFTKESLEEVLSRNGYRPEAKTLITWEGVTMYLPKDAIDGTLSFVTNHAGPGSSILFDYFDETMITQEHHSNRWKTWAELVAGWGEPWIFGLPNSGEGNVFQLVAEHGLEVKSDYSMGELCVKYLPPEVSPGTFGLSRWAWRMCHAKQQISAG